MYHFFTAYCVNIATPDTYEDTIVKTLDVETIHREQGYECLMKIFHIVTDIYKQKPIVIDADNLQRNPGDLYDTSSKSGAG